MKYSIRFRSFVYIVLSGFTSLLFSCHSDNDPLKKNSTVKILKKIPKKNKYTEPAVVPVVQDSVQFTSDTLRTDTTKSNFQETRKLDSKYFRKSFTLYKKPLIA